MGCCNDAGFLSPSSLKKKKIEAAVAEVLVIDLGKLICLSSLEKTYETLYSFLIAL